ncbi:hypothetical protein [Escherichia coli]|uniref:hypothetical protein n=1 Tax=Escherichia coli TaxID=562 RepID=UPI00201F7372|nr:hypothetical protein [Escherichia coli]
MPSGFSLLHIKEEPAEWRGLRRPAMRLHRMLTEYRFWVTYSLHCFTKDYEHQTNEEKQSLMYHAPKESRPFCQHRYNLARTHLKRTILALPESNVIHAGYGSYAVIEVDLDGGDKAFYFVAFRAFREKKKLRLHVTSAYPAYSALFDHGLASKSDQRFASIRSTGNLTFSTAF